MSDTYAQYIKAIKSVAQQVQNPAEAFNLSAYVAATIPDSTGTDYHPTISTLSTVIMFWNEHGLLEDGLLPAVDILHALALFGYNTADDLAHLVRMTHLHDEFVADTDACYSDDNAQEYSEFCDKFADELNA